MEKELRGLKEHSVYKTEVMHRKSREAKEKAESERRKNAEKEKELIKIKELEESSLKAKADRKRIEEEIARLKYTAPATRELEKSELRLAEAKLLELKIRRAHIASIFHELKQAEKVDLCFMLDATGSMSSYIAEAKTVIHKIVHQLADQFKDLELRVAFVGYRDHSDGEQRVTVLDFSEDKETFKTFVSSVEAKGGADECEDVFGGLEVCHSYFFGRKSSFLIVDTK